MPASTTLLQRLLTAGAVLSLVAAVGVNASVARAITAPTITILDINTLTLFASLLAVAGVALSFRSIRAARE